MQAAAQHPTLCEAPVPRQLTAAAPSHTRPPAHLVEGVGVVGVEPDEPHLQPLGGAGVGQGNEVGERQEDWWGTVHSGTTDAVGTCDHAGQLPHGNPSSGFPPPC